MWIWAKLKSYVIAAGVILAAIAGAYILGRRDGDSIAHSQMKDDLIEDVSKQKELKNEVDSLSDGALSGRVQRWTRK